MTEENIFQYRYNTVKEFSTELKTLADEYLVKIKKYRRRITAIDVVVYSTSGLIVGGGVILSSVTMIAPIVVPIVISSITTLGGVAVAISKKLSSCSEENLTSTRQNIRLFLAAIHNYLR